MSEYHKDVHQSVTRVQNRGSREESGAHHSQMSEMIDGGAADHPAATTNTPGPGGVILRVVIAIAVTIIAAMAPSLMTAIPGIRELLNGDVIGRGTTGLVVAYAVGTAAFALATVAALVMCRLLRRTLDRGRGVDLRMRPSGRAIAWMLVMAAIAAAVLCATAGITHILGARGEVLEPSGDSAWGQIIAGIAVGFLLQGVPEELIWRGWLFSSLGGTRKAAIISVLAFSLIHLISQGGQQEVAEHIIYLIMPCGFAIAAMTVRMVSGTTWAAIGVHGGLHLANNMLGHHLGVPNGPTTWIVNGLLWAVVGAAILFIGVRSGRLSRV